MERSEGITIYDLRLRVGGAGVEVGIGFGGELTEGVDDVRRGEDVAEVGIEDGC